MINAIAQISSPDKKRPGASPSAVILSWYTTPPRSFSDHDPSSCEEKSTSVLERRQVFRSPPPPRSRNASRGE